MESELSLEEALADLERPKSHLFEPTHQTLAIRLYGTPLLHRAVPTPVALRLAALRGRLEWRLVARRRREALALAETIGVSPDEAARRRFARSRVIEDAVQAELKWRTWLWYRLRLEGLEHFEAARARGGGVLLANAHIGPFLGSIYALAARGVKVYVSGSNWGGDVSRRGRRGRWTQMQDRGLEATGSRWIHRGGSYPLFRALLERGEVCLLAADAPGEHEAELAGRTVHVRGGIASLALETGTPVVPVLTLRRGRRQVVTFYDPIDPAAFADPAKLTQCIFDALSPAIARHLEQVHPNLISLWERSPSLAEMKKAPR